MRIEQFLSSHGIGDNPFASAEEAQGDEILTRILEQNDYNFGHPAWQKFRGVPPGNQTSVVFGPKGSGKTAMRLSLEKSIEQHNLKSPEDKALLVRYSEFNPYLDRWKGRTDSRNNEKLTWWDRVVRKRVPTEASLKAHWKFDHHIDAILSEVATRIPDLLQESPGSPQAWSVLTKHDVLFLVAAYLPTEATKYRDTVRAAQNALYTPWRRCVSTALRSALWVCTLAVAPLCAYWRRRVYARRADERIEIFGRELKDTAWAFGRLPGSYLRVLPLLRSPHAASGRDDHQEERYELLGRMRNVISNLGYARTAVVIDKVDEPTLIRGDADRMCEFIRPLINNKLAQFEKLHFKMLLPNQLNVLRRKADPQAAIEQRLDKFNVIDPFLWSGVDLYQMLLERVTVCSEDGTDMSDLQGLFDPDIQKMDVVGQLEKLKTPRYANKFMDRLIRETCSSEMGGDRDLPGIPAKVFYRVSADMEAEIRSDIQDLKELL
jgi:hypothetical protein